MKEWHFEEKIYRRWVVLMICSFDELLEELKSCEYKYVDDVVKTAGYNFRLTLDNSNQTCTVVWMPKFSAGVLVHELSHLVMHTFNQTSVPIDIDNEEGFAFYLAYWFEEMMRVYKRYPNGRTAKEAKK